MVIKTNTVGLSRGDTAMLLSPVYNNPNKLEHCVLFWYHMSGKYMGTFNMQVNSDGKGFNGQFSVSGKTFCCTDNCFLMQLLFA